MNIFDILKLCPPNCLCKTFLFYKIKYLDNTIPLHEFINLYSNILTPEKIEAFQDVVKAAPMFNVRKKTNVFKTLRHTELIKKSIETCLTEINVPSNNWEHLSIYLKPDEWSLLCFQLIETCLCRTSSIKLLKIAMNIGSSYLLSLLIPGAIEMNVICENLILKIYVIVYTIILELLQDRRNLFNDDEIKELGDIIEGTTKVTKIFLENFPIKKYEKIINIMIDAGVMYIMAFCNVGTYTGNYLVMLPFLKQGYDILMLLCKKTHDARCDMTDLFYQLFVRTLCLRTVKQKRGFDVITLEPFKSYKNLDHFFHKLIFVYKEKCIFPFSKLIPILSLSKKINTIPESFCIKLAIEYELMSYLVTDELYCLEILSLFVRNCTIREKISFIRYLKCAINSLDLLPARFHHKNYDFRREIECMHYLFKYMAHPDQKLRTVTFRTVHYLLMNPSEKLAPIVWVYFNDDKRHIHLPKPIVANIMSNLLRMHEVNKYFLNGLLKGIRHEEPIMAKHTYDILVFILSCRRHVFYSTEKAADLLLNSNIQIEKYFKKEVSYFVINVVKDNFKKHFADELLILFLTLHGRSDDCETVEEVFRYIVDNLCQDMHHTKRKSRYAYRMVKLISKSQCATVFKTYMKKFMLERSVNTVNVAKYETQLRTKYRDAAIFLLGITSEHIISPDTTKITDHLIYLLEEENALKNCVETVAVYNIVSNYYSKLNIQQKGTLLRTVIYKMLSSSLSVSVIPVYYHIFNRIEPLFMINVAIKPTHIFLDIRAKSGPDKPFQVQRIIIRRSSVLLKIENIMSSSNDADVALTKTIMKKIKKQKRRKPSILMKKRKSYFHSLPPSSTRAHVGKASEQLTELDASTFKNIIYNRMKPLLMEMLKNCVYCKRILTYLHIYSFIIMDGLKAPHAVVVKYLIKALAQVEENPNIFNHPNAVDAEDVISSIIIILGRFTLLDETLFARVSKIWHNLFDVVKVGKVIQSIIMAVSEIKDVHTEMGLTFTAPIMKTLFSKNRITRQYSINYFEEYLKIDSIKLSGSLLHAIIILVTDCNVNVQTTAMNIIQTHLKDKFPRMIYTCFKESIFIFNGNINMYKEKFEVFDVNEEYKYLPPIRTKRKMALLLHLLQVDNDRLNLLYYLEEYQRIHLMLADRVVTTENKNTIKDIIFIIKIILDGTLIKVYRLLMHQRSMNDTKTAMDFRDSKKLDEKFEATKEKEVVQIYFDEVDTDDLTAEELVQLDDIKVDILKNLREIVRTLPSVYSIIMQRAPECAFYAKRLAETIASFYGKHITEVISKDPSYHYIFHYYDNILKNTPPKNAQYKCYNDYWQIGANIEYDPADEETSVVPGYIDDDKHMQIEDYETSSSEFDVRVDATSSFEDRIKRDANRSASRLMKIAHEGKFNEEDMNLQVLNAFKALANEVGLHRHCNN